MKTVITALNAKFIHMSLAPWYLKAMCGNTLGDIVVEEHTINENIEKVLSTLYIQKADIYAFSCYIWNIGRVLKIAENLKKLYPSSFIVFGGPEVSFGTEKFLKEHNFVDFIVAGEAEDSFRELLQDLRNKDSSDIVRNIPGDGVKYSSENLNNIPSPYTDEMLKNAKNKIIYFESSRGCPFSCSYCLSSTLDGVRYFSMERVKNDLKKLIQSEINQVKFVDRTFNCNSRRAKEIFRYIIKNSGNNINFHFEVAGDLFDDEMIDILSFAPPGLIQFEAGIQSTDSGVLEIINRKSDITRAFYNIKKIMNMGNIHVHLDLIAGLPGEKLKSFRKSFNDVYQITPHHLQLGFLKLLKGSCLRKDAEMYDFKFREYPPYEVLSNKFMSFDEIIKLKEIEEVFERYYNSKRFVNTIKYIVNNLYESPFNFYDDFAGYNKKSGYLDRPVAAGKLYGILLSFIEKNFPHKYTIINEILKFDFLHSNRTGNPPHEIKRYYLVDQKRKCFDFLRNENNIEKYLHSFKDLSAKQIYKKVHFEVFEYDVLSMLPKKTIILFNYECRNRVTGLYEYKKIIL